MDYNKVRLPRSAFDEIAKKIIVQGNTFLCRFKLQTFAIIDFVKIFWDAHQKVAFFKYLLDKSRNAKKMHVPYHHLSQYDVK